MADDMVQFAGFIPMSREILEDARWSRAVMAAAMEDWRLTLDVGPVHGPWLREAIPPHLDVSNQWWWLPEEDEECNCDG